MADLVVVVAAIVMLTLVIWVVSGKGKPKGSSGFASITAIHDFAP